MVPSATTPVLSTTTKSLSGTVDVPSVPQDGSGATGAEPVVESVGRGSRPGHGRLLLTLVVVVVLAAGSAASLAAGLAERNRVIADQTVQFNAMASDLTTAVAAQLSRDADLLASQTATMAMLPQMTNAQFKAWFDRATLNRYPGLLSAGYQVRVPQAGLAAFATLMTRDPMELASGPFDVLPPGDRTYYCFSRLGATVPGAVAITTAPGLDLCTVELTRIPLEESASSGAVSLLSIGRSTTVALAGPTGTSVSVSHATQRAAAPSRMSGFMVMLFAPVYAGSPKTASERQAQLVGWTSVLFDGPSIVRDLMRGHPDLALTLRWDEGGRDVMVAQQPPAFRGPALSHVSTLTADGQWTLELSTSANVARVAAAGQARTVTLIGMILTLLVAAMLWLAIGARNRAVRLVDAKTAELRHQSLHDALTGLPNRALMQDRAIQMLARARRESGSLAAMFIDLDYFKRVNDTLGHPVGDRLLCAVAERMSLVLRSSDTLARLGGDEFVVLTGDDSLAEGPEFLAQRLLSALEPPFVLDGVTQPLVVSASIGIAVGLRPSAADLLRDADIALYQAKAAGRACYVTFKSGMGAAQHERLDPEADTRVST